MKTGLTAAAAALLLLAQPAHSQETKVALGLSGWTGFAIAAVAGVGGALLQLIVFWRPPRPGGEPEG